MTSLPVPSRKINKLVQMYLKIAAISHAVNSRAIAVNSIETIMLQ